MCVLIVQYYSYFLPVQGERQSFEILYPGVFTDWHPYHGKPAVSVYWQPHVAAGSNILPINYLSHVTHNQQADNIEGDKFFIFKPKTKVGKHLVFDGSPLGETFKAVNEDRFDRIPFGCPVFPGQITWWGVSMHKSQETDQGKALKEATRTFFNLADYLTSPVCSRYGNNEFIVPFHDVMSRYKISRTDCGVKNVYLKLGGTLRYKLEVCYVIIVAMEEDITDDEELKELPSVHNKPPFIHNGCIDEDGKVINEEKPSFEISHIFSNTIWDTLAFGFYFPRHSRLSLKCPKDFCKITEIEHEFCTSTKPPRGGGKWVCPNKNPLTK